MKNACLVSGCALALLIAKAGAEPAATEKVVVTASAAAQSITNAPASIAVVTAEDLHAKPIQDISDALQHVEGVTLSRSGNQRTIQLRGLSSAYTLIMIDGKRVNSSSSMFRGNDFDASWLPVEAIDRVEVVRGPMSSLYGSDAIGGVVNIITKDVGDVWTGSLSADYTLQENGAAGDSYKTNFYTSGPLVDGTLGLKVWGGYDRRLKDGAINASGQAGFPDQHETFANAALVYKPDAKSKIEAEGGYSVLNHDGFAMDRQSYALTALRDFGIASAQMRVYGDRIHNAVGNTTGQTNPNTSSTMVAEARVTLPLPAWLQTLTVGTDYRRQTLRDASLLVGLPGSPEYGTDTTAAVGQWSVFAEDEIVLTDALRVTVGDRFDRHDNFGGHHSPRAYVVWHALPELTFRGGWSQAFRAPTLLQNSPKWGSVSCGSPTVGCYIIGNPDLKPETSTSLEFGLRFDVAGISGGVTVFQNNLRNMIDITSRTANVTLAPSYPNFVGYLADGRPIFAYQNVTKVRTRGVESSIQTKLDDDVTASLNYTYLDARNLSYTPAWPMTYQPNHSVNGKLEWQALPELSVYAAGSLIGKQYLSVTASAASTVKRGSYAIFDLGARYDIRENTALRFGIANIADRTITRDISTQYNEDGRRYFAALTQRF